MLEYHDACEYHKYGLYSGHWPLQQLFSHYHGSHRCRARTCANTILLRSETAQELSAWPSNHPVPGKSTPPAAVEELLKVQSSAHKLSVQSHMLITSRFDEWAKEFGSIVGLKFGPQNVVILNTYHHVKE